MTETKKHPTWRYQSFVQSVLRTAAQLLLLKPWVWSVLTVRVHGRENLKKLKSNQAFIVIANHSSHFDAPLIAGALPRRLSRRLAVGAAADYFFKAWYKALPTRALFNTFPIDRGESTRYKGLTGQLLNEQVPVMIMPEGTRSRTGKIAPFKPGVAALSTKHQVPVVPIALIGAHAAWPPGARVWRAGRPRVDINFGEPLSPKPNESVEQFNKRMRDVVVKLYKKKRA
ncbi:1-acyl-sn-glycerol-3-phosphate acyltransferase [Candidatus Saccharibacteria bacterium]|nr:1-acyl-sn-glycerol-3-phosphate acyltransferase [Candidatus Saccharibacteria bacterium]